MDKAVLVALATLAVIVVAAMLWKQKKECVEPIPLRGGTKRGRRLLRLNAAEPCPPPACGDFAVCSTGNLRKRLQASAGRFPDIDQTKMSDALAMRLLQGCDGTDVGACADFLPYVCSCSGLSDLCRNAPDPKPDVCKQDPRTPTAAYGISCSDIRLRQGPCPCDCDGGDKRGSCPDIAGAWHLGDTVVQITTEPVSGGAAICKVVFNIGGSVLPGFIPRDKPTNIFWSFDSSLPPAVIDPSLKRIMHQDRLYTKD
jgi:hypothetical protein